MLFRLPALLLLAGLGAQEKPPEPTGTIEGTVIGPGRERVPLAEVWVMRNNEEIARIMADGTGYFALHRLPLGAMNVYATREDRTIGRVSAALLPTQTHATVQVSVRAGGAIRGRILDPDGEPLVGAHLVVASSDLRLVPNTLHVTDAQGRFAVEHHPEGEVELFAVARGFELQRRAHKVLGGVEQTFQMDRVVDPQIVRDLDEVMKQVRVRRYRSPTRRNGTNGVQIIQIPLELRELTGLRNGDVIVEINDVPFHTRDQAIETLASFRSAGVVDFRLRLMSRGTTREQVYRLPVK